MLYFLYLVNPNYLLTVYSKGLHIFILPFNSHGTTTAILNDMESINIFRWNASCVQAQQMAEVTNDIQSQSQTVP